MRKQLLLCLSFCVVLATYAAPWDIKVKPQIRVVNNAMWSNPFKAFTDPYITGCFSAEVSKNYQPNHAVQIQVTFDHSVPVPYYVIVSVLGDWSTNPGYATEKLFTILFNTGQYTKTVNYPMASTEETYDENTYVYDYGPQ